MTYAKNAGVWPPPEAEDADDSGQPAIDKPPAEKPSEVKQTRADFAV